MAPQTSRDNSHDPPTPERLLAEGSALVHQWKAHAALDPLQRALEVFRRDPSRAREVAECHTQLGWALDRLSRHDEALPHLKTALSLYRSLSDTEREQARCLTLLAQSLYSLARYDAALARQEEALVLLASLPDAGQARAAGQFNLGNILFLKGRYREALRAYESAQALYRSAGGSKIHEAKAIGSIGRCLRALGQPRQSIERFEAALALFRKAPHTQLFQALTHESVALAEWDLGRFEACLEALGRALALFRTVEGSERHQAGVQFHVGRALMILGRHAEALLKYTQALALQEKLVGTEREQGWIHANIGISLIALGRPEEALERLRRARALLEPIDGTERDQGPVLQATAQALTALGQYEEALAILDEAEALLIRVEAPGREVAAGPRLAGEALRRAGRPDEAAARFERAAALCDPEQDAEELWEIQYGRGRAEEARGNLLGAVAAYLDSIGFLEGLRGEMLDRGNRVAFFQEKTAVYGRLVALLLAVATGQVDNVDGAGLTRDEPRLLRWGEAPAAMALALAEAAKARALSDLLREGRPPAEAVPQEWRDEERRLNDEVARLFEELHALDPDAGAAGEELRERLRVLELERDLVAMRIRRAARPGLSPAAFLTLPQIQALLAPDEALLEYMLLPESIGANDPSDSRLALWLVTRSDLRVYVTALPAGEPEAPLLQMTRRLRLQPERLGLAERVRLYRFPMECRLRTAGKLGVREHQRVGRLLADALLPFEAREFLKSAGIRHLAIVPDGILHHVPFGALILAEDTDPAAPPRYEACRYLIHDFAVAAVPSATALAALRERAAARRAAAPDERRSLLAFADPIFSAADPRVALDDPALFAAERREPPHSIDARLLATADEALAVAALFPDAEVHLGADATKAHLHAADPARFRYLLFATHAHVDEKRPLFSYVRLTVTGEDSGLLHAREIFELDLDAELVTLSACQSGLGKLDRGEGIVGLSTAFFAAGARSLLTSLWKVIDQPTAALIPRLHAHLRNRGLSRAEALRRAQLELIAASPEYAHPFFWAFMLLGDWRDDSQGGKT